MNQFAPLSKNRTLTGAQKSAILFLCLGEARGGTIMQQLDEEEIRQITKAISNMGEVDAALVEEIIAEFDQKVNHVGSVVGSIEAAKALLNEFLPEERVTEILSEIGQNSAGNVWKDLSNLDEKQLLSILVKEHNQTVAVILSRIRPDVAAKILPLLGADRAADLIQRMMGMERLPSDTIKSIETTLRDGIMARVGQSPEAKIEGQLVSIFNKMDEELFNTITKALEKDAPDQLQVIKQKMFVFDDLTKFSAVMLGKIMREVSAQALPLALRGAKKEVREHFLASLPARSRDMLQEEMSSMGPVKSRDVKDAQSQLVDAAQRLIADGTVSLPESEEDLITEVSD